MSFDTYYRLEIRKPGFKPDVCKTIRSAICQQLKKVAAPSPEFPSPFGERSFMEMYYLQKIFESDGILQDADSEAIKFDFCILSEIYPDLTFTLYGDADDTSIWVAYFRNGKEAGGEGHYVYPELPEGW